MNPSSLDIDISAVFSDASGQAATSLRSVRRTPLEIFLM